MSEPVYIVYRESAEGLEADVFTDESLAKEWAYCLGVNVDTQYPIDRSTLDAMKESREGVEP